MKVALPLAKNVLAPLGLTAAMSAIEGSIQKKIHDSGVKLITEQEDMKDIMKIIKALENSGILLKEVSKTIKNETEEQRGRFLSMLLGTLGARYAPFACTYYSFAFGSARYAPFSCSHNTFSTA